MTLYDDVAALAVQCETEQDWDAAMVLNALAGAISKRNNGGPEMTQLRAYVLDWIRSQLESEGYLP